MFYPEKVEPISKLIGLGREATNEEMQAAANIALEMACSFINCMNRIAIALEAIS